MPPPTQLLDAPQTQIDPEITANSNSTTSESADPWSSTPGDQALALLAEELPVVAWSSGSLRAPSSGAFALDASDQELAALPAAVPESSSSRLMSLKGNSGSLEHPSVLLSASVVSSHWPFLRELQLQDAGLDEFPVVDSLTELISLDLSFNPLQAMHYPPEGVLGKLLVLCMDGCEIDALSPVLGSRLPQLMTLGLVDNQLEELSAVAAVESCKSLTTVNLAENDLCSSAAYPKQLLQWAPGLKRVDMHFMNTTSASVSLGDRKAYLASTKAHSKGVIDDQTDSSTCSCVEGNPCASDEHCFATVQQLIDLGLATQDPGVDPAMRVSICHRKEEVAKAARKKKGMPDL